MIEQRPRWRIVAATIAVVLVGLGAEWLAHGTRIGFEEQRDLAAGWLVAGAGLAAWAWVPRSRVGPLLVLAGLAWFIGTLGDPVTEIGRMARAVTFLYAGVLAHALFTWPSGRPSDPLDHVLIMGAYVVALFPALWDRDNSLLIVSGLLASCLVVRHVTLPYGARRVRRPATLLGLLLALTLATKGMVAAALRGQGIAYPGDPLALWQVSLVVVAVGLAWSLIALERRRRSMTDLVVRLGEGEAAPGAAELAASTDLADDPAIIDALRRADAMSARNVELRGELSAQVVALEASRRRLLDAEDDERVALEGRLRQGAALRLARVAAGLATTPDRGTPAPADAEERVSRARAQLAQALVELDELARGLAPGTLSERHLAGALADLAGRSPIPVVLAIGALEAQEQSIERALYFVASEALANVIKHAHAARAWVRVDADTGQVTMVVEDDGIGGADVGAGSGLRGLRDRLDALGGTLSVDARLGGGTSLRASIPRTATGS